MAKSRLETLKSVDAEFLGRHCIGDDLEQLVTPPFGVISSFESVLSDLRRILARNLGHVAPDAITQASDSDRD
ncbi:hypothetical protein [Mesorhizobium caraganae]|uniref:hypothetical protein n=1 Tax=Mesorhizobium caraganae TaxID=483206 RepID=UPI003ECC3FE8